MENEEVELENEVNSTSEVENVETQQPRTYSQEEVDEMKKEIHEKNQIAWDKRWGKQSAEIEGRYTKHKEVVDLLMEQTGANSVDDLLNNAYKQYGVEKPEPTRNTKDEERLGKLDAQDILSLEDNHIVAEANRLAGIDKRTPREEAMFMELGAYLTNKEKQEKLNQEIKENGFDEKIVSSDEFKSFASKFNENTSLKDIYEIYSNSHSKPKQKPFSAGSAKGKDVKEVGEFFTEEEFLALTAEDLKNPNIYKKAMNSRYNFK